MYAQLDDVIGDGGISGEQPVDIEIGDRCHAYQEAVTLSIHHIFGDKGIIDIIDIDDAHRIAGDLPMVSICTSAGRV